MQTHDGQKIMSLNKRKKEKKSGKKILKNPKVNVVSRMTLPMNTTCKFLNTPSQTHDRRNIENLEECERQEQDVGHLGAYSKGGDGFRSRWSTL